MFTRGEANLVVDESPYNLAYNFASVEEEPLLEEGTLLSDGSYISAMILPEPVVEAVKTVGCPISSQCVSLLKESGFETTGNAINIKPNTKDPCRGCAILMYSGRFGHVGIVYDYDRDYVCFKEKNFAGCGIINVRCLPINSSIIRGYLIK